MIFVTHKTKTKKLPERPKRIQMKPWLKTGTTKVNVLTYSQNFC